MTLTALMVFFILKTRKTFSAKLPALFFASGFFFALYYYAFAHRSAMLAGLAIIFGNGMGYLMGPTMLFFIRSLRAEKQVIITKYLKHLIPFFAQWLIISLPLGLSLIFRPLLSEYGQFLADIGDYSNLVENGVVLFYVWLSWKEIGRTEDLVRSNYSSFDHKDLGWCKSLITGIAAIIVADSTLSIYELIYPPTEIIWNPGLIIAILLVVFFAVLGYRGTMQSRILLPNFLLGEESTEKETADTRSYDSLFSTAEADKLIANLDAVMRNEKPFLNESLTLGELAKRIGLTDKRLSELLNRHMSTSFYDYVNAYRIETFKEKVADSSNDHLTLLALAFESGFQSKTSFNRVFKQKEEMSPSEYKRSVSAIARA